MVLVTVTEVMVQDTELDMAILVVILDMDLVMACTDLVMAQVMAADSVQGINLL
jgi:hypothetical protein